MKTLVIVSALTLTAGMGQAAPFAFEQQLGSPDLDPTLGQPRVVSSRVSPSDFTPSIHNWYRGNPDVDVRAGVNFNGTIVPSGPTRISLYEIYRGSPDGTAYRSYHARYPVDTDWAAIAREHRRTLHDAELANKPASPDAGS